MFATVSQELEAEFGTGFSDSSLPRMVRFANLFPDERIVVPLIQESAWPHAVELLQLDAKSIRVAEYLTELPPPELLRERLHRALAAAREHAAREHAAREHAALPAREGDDA
jgi:hypothetical protein